MRKGKLSGIKSEIMKAEKKKTNDVLDEKNKPF